MTSVFQSRLPWCGGGAGVVGLLLMFAGVAQSSTAGLRILVEDSLHTPIPAANVVTTCTGQSAVAGTTDSDGVLRLEGLPAAACTVSATAALFAPQSMSVTLTDAVASEVKLELQPKQAQTEINVSAEESSERTTAAQATWSGQQIRNLPLINSATGFTDVLTRTTPGVSADSNGFAHPLGEHADTSISLDGQPITDQQAKVFSNQLDPNVIQSLTAVTGAPPVEFGGKTSLVVTVVSKSGLGQRPAGYLNSASSSFGTWTENLGFSNGGEHWGNFVAISAGASGRFLDSPEIDPIHDRGNNSSAFDRFDWHPRERDLLHVNLWAGRSWFQTPNSFEAAALNQDQRSQIHNANVAFGWTHVLAPNALWNFTTFLRHDRSQYFPSNDLFADSPATLAQDRRLTNAGLRLDTEYTHGSHTVKAGGTYWQTLLHERFAVGLTDPLYNAPCVDREGEPVAAIGVRAIEACGQRQLQSNAGFLDRLLPFDLSRGGTLYSFNDRARVRESAFYVSDEIKRGTLNLSLGLRYDLYRGLSRGRQLQPRLGLTWRVSNTGLRVRASYARLFETPYNENLIFANSAGQGSGRENPFADARSEPVRPGTRNQFNVGVEQSLGKHLKVDADYYWKFTRNAFDFDTLFNTPITFSVAWRQSKIDGLALRINLLEWHGLTAYSVMGHVRSRFFPPEVGGLIFNSAPSNGVFRIDHGEEFEQTTNLRYQLASGVLGRFRPWVSGVWRFNSGLALPDTVPTYYDALALPADQQAQMGLRCGADFATPQRAIRTCSEADFGATRVRIPPLGLQNDDTRPVRVAPRHLFDISIGEDQLFKVERFSVGLQLSVVNVTNRIALYNFLSTFSGTHFVPPRSYQAALRIVF